MDSAGAPRIAADMWKTCALLALIVLAACGGANNLPSPVAQSVARGTASSPISHVVLIIQENRSFDNLFDCFKGTDCVKRGKERVKKGGKFVDKWIKLSEQDLQRKTGKNPDIGHCYFAWYTAYDAGKMDGFNQEPLNYCPRKWGGQYTHADAYPYEYVNPADITPYWDMAEQYVLADRMFTTQGSSSFTAHQDLIRGGTVVDTTGDSMIDTPSGDPWGCDALSKSTVTDLITPALKWELDAGPFPCSNQFQIGSSSYETLADLLDAKQIGWHYYSPCYIGSPKSGPCGGSCGGSNCDDGAGATLNAFDVIYRVRYGPEWGTNVSMPQTNIFSDIANGQLQPMTWIVPSQDDSDHPGDTTDNGPQWVASLVNAIGESSYWKSTAIVVVWDDWGGLYDHVAPPGNRDMQGGPGFRVPMIVISPYVAQGHVYHTSYRFGSIIKYVEQNFGLPSLGTTDTTSNSIINMFDYSQAPRQFESIPSSLGIDHFKHEPPSSVVADPE
jgi:phospholipase C